MGTHKVAFGIPFHSYARVRIFWRKNCVRTRAFQNKLLFARACVHKAFALTPRLYTCTRKYDNSYFARTCARRVIHRSQARERSYCGKSVARSRASASGIGGNKISHVRAKRPAAHLFIKTIGRSSKVYAKISRTNTRAHTHTLHGS